MFWPMVANRDEDKYGSSTVQNGNAQGINDPCVTDTDIHLVERMSLFRNQADKHSHLRCNKFAKTVFEDITREPQKLVYRYIAVIDPLLLCML